MSDRLTIWKYPLSVTDEQTVMMPEGALVLSVDVQDGELYLWAMVSQNKPLEKRAVTIIGTGNPIAAVPARFIGTVQMPPFVWHVFVDYTMAESLGMIL